MFAESLAETIGENVVGCNKKNGHHEPEEASEDHVLPVLNLEQENKKDHVSPSEHFDLLLDVRRLEGENKENKGNAVYREEKEVMVLGQKDANDAKLHDLFAKCSDKNASSESPREGAEKHPI